MVCLGPVRGGAQFIVCVCVCADPGDLRGQVIVKNCDSDRFLLLRLSWYFKFLRDRIGWSLGEIVAVWC